MTEKQIKSLKIGDKFTIEYYVYRKTDNGHFLIHYSDGDSYGAPTYCWEGFKHATLVTPPPTFEKGDTVRIVADPLTGTVYGKHFEIEGLDGKLGTIVFAPDGSGRAVVEMEEDIAKNNLEINVHCLELVKKAVKNKYAVEEDDLAWCVSEKGWSICSFNKSSHPSAKAAAEAECARLNAEWRKQQEGGAE